MPVKNSETHYGQVARVLHWASVALLLTVFVIGDQIGDLPENAEKSARIGQHVSYGILLLLVMLVRLSWRVRNLNPIWSYNIARWQKNLAKGVHWFIYSAVIVQCVLGIFQSDLSGYPFKLFEVVSLGPFMETNNDLGERLGDVHKSISNLILIVLAVHISAAIYHQVFGVVDSD